MELKTRMLTYGSATCTHTAHGALLTKLPGGPGRLPSQGSHRSGRAELPHPARQNTALLRGEPVHNARSREREALQQRAHAMPVYVPGVGAA